MPAALTDLHLERAALRTVLLDPSFLLGSELTDEHFTSARHSAVWRALCQVAADGDEMGTEAVRTALVSAGRFETVGDEWLLELTESVERCPENGVRRLRELAHLRALQQGIADAQTACEAGDLRKSVEAVVALADVANDTTEQRQPAIEWTGTSEIFAPLPPVDWKIKGLQIAPGRPALFAAYGASKKTLATQSLALAVASGTPAWGHFETKQGVVRHLDYEQGLRATMRRYQRLAIGHGISQAELDGMLQLAAFPTVYLDQPGAEDAYALACDGADLVVIDALRGATPGTDENDSAIRTCLDALSRVSERTGTAFWVIHHAGKPKDSHSDPRTIARGSSAIFDASGCVYVGIAGKEQADPTKVIQTKRPADSEGTGVEDFLLAAQDIEVAGDPTAGVRIVRLPDQRSDPVQVAGERYEQVAGRLLGVVRANPGTTQNVILTRAGVGRTAGSMVLAALVDQGRLAETAGPRKSKIYRVGVAR